MFLEAAKRIDRKAAEFQCPHCPYVGKVFRNFKEHVMSHSEQRPYVCSICCSSFVCKSKLVRHQRQVHNEARPFLCSECPYTGKSRSCLETHRLVMHPREENLSFLCPHCPAKFARASMLKTHALRHNTGPHKLFSCLSCSFSTNYRRQFDLHATLHTGKSCLCSLCGKAYSGQAQLRVHMRVQHSDQSFRCTLCDFVTKRPDGLTKHMKSHSTERPYLCPHCDYKGKRNAHLQRHLLRHRNKDQALVKNEKPEVAAAERFPCLSCDKVFKTRDKLMHHLKTHNIPDTHISDNIQSNLNSTSFSTSDIHTSTSISPGTSNSFYYNPNMANGATNNNSKSWATVPVQHFTPSRLSSVTSSTTTICPHNPLKQTNTDSSLHSTPSFFTSRVHLEVPHSDTFITQPTSHATANAPPLISPYKLSSSNMPLTNEQLGMAVSAIEPQHSHQFPVITAPSGKSALGIQNLDMSMAAPEVAPSLSNHLYGLMAPVVASPISNDHETSSAHTSTSELGRQQHYCSGTSFSSQHAGVIASQKPFCVDTHYQSVSASTVTPSTVHQHPHQTPSVNTTLPMDYLPHNNVVTSEDKMQHQDGLSSVAPPSLSNHYPGLPPSMPPDVPMPSPANPAHHLQKAITTYQYESRDASST
ncbi:hypothetical protein EGW08_018793 [Elysia chlorotica]|uniref:C2H2-type domain-containing protein n=1 Tax=Elysia chlorotica TaxID=188477 RepID=A0A433SVU4_ELYCH|nr:hypothetical protein EGW08_018793 [Elysia chlorotica]